MTRTLCTALAVISVLLAPPCAAASLQELATIVDQWRPPVGCRVDRVVPSPDMTTVGLRQGDHQIVVLLAPLPPVVAPGQGTPLLSLLWLTDPRHPDALWQPALRSLQDHIAAADHGQFAQTRVLGAAPPQGLVAQTWVLLALSLLALPFALWLAWTELPGSKRGWMALLALAWMLRAIAPHRLVMVHFGYLHVDQAVDLGELPRYGPATTLLDHALFWVLPAHHKSVQWMHTVLGTLTLVPLGALAQRIGQASAARWTALVLAALPLAWLDHGSESMLVPALLWWSAATVCVVHWIDRPRWPLLASAVVLLALCGLSRPDCLLVGAPTALLVVLAVHDPRVVLQRWRGLTVALVVLAVLYLPDLQFLRERTAQDLAQGNLPRLNLSFVSELPQRMLQGWVVLDPRYFALPLTVLAASGLGLPAVRRPVTLLWLAALLWALPMLLDFNESSKLRLHMPSALLVVVAAAVAAGAWLQTVGQRRRSAMLAGAAVAVAFGTAPTMGRVLSAQLSDASEEVLAEATRLARDGHPTALVVRAYGDAPAQGIHLYWPNYLLEPGDRWLSVADWQAGRMRPGERALGVIDVRCWAKLPDHHLATPQHPACAALEAAAVGTPLWRQGVGNIGERGFGWYPQPEVVPEFEQAVLALPQVPAR